MSRRPSLTQSALLLTLVGLIRQSLTFLSHIAIARLVGAQAMGLVQLILPAYAVMQSFCIAGLSVSVAVLASELHAKQNTLALQQMVKTALHGLVLLWFPVALVVLTNGDVLARVVLGDSRTRAGLLLLLPALLLTGVEHLHKQACYGIGLISLPAVSEVAEQLARCLAILALLLAVRPQDDTIAAALITAGMLVSEVVSSLFLTLGLHRHHPIPAGHLLPSTLLRRRMGAIALPVSLTALLGNLMESATAIALPKLLVVYGLSPAEAMSEFGILMGMTLPMLSIPTAFVNGLTLALLPRLTEARTLGQHNEFQRISETAIRSVSYVLLPSVALIAVFAPRLGTLLFHEPQAASHIGGLAVVVCAECYHMLLVCILHALGRQGESAVISLSCGGVQLAVTLLLTGHLGLTGFIAGRVFSDAIAIPLCLFRIHRTTTHAIPLGRCFVVPILAVLMAWAVVSFLIRSGSDILAQPLPILVVGGAVYLLTLHAQGVPIGHAIREN